MATFLWWSILCVLCLLLELSSPGFFFFLSFCAGAGLAAITAVFYESTFIEFAVFLGVSIATFLVLRKVLEVVRPKELKTNVYALVGKKGQVVSVITPFVRGWIQVEGELWSAAPVDGSTLEKDELVEVVQTAGSHLVVKRIKNS